MIKLNGRDLISGFGAEEMLLVWAMSEKIEPAIPNRQVGKKKGKVVTCGIPGGHLLEVSNFGQGNR